ncbi:hypothetical protein MIR68_010419 [Amoeboaphelidium protococcarum]|nr:hypothetical protein MIR68_010419 [Amoeboaphelidium protococcarum]
MVKRYGNATSSDNPFAPVQDQGNTSRQRDQKQAQIEKNLYRNDSDYGYEMVQKSSGLHMDSQDGHRLQAPYQRDFNEPYGYQNQSFERLDHHGQKQSAYKNFGSNSPYQAPPERQQQYEFAHDYMQFKQRDISRQQSRESLARSEDHRDISIKPNAQQLLRQQMAEVARKKELDKQRRLEEERLEEERIERERRELARKYELERKNEKAIGQKGTGESGDGEVMIFAGSKKQSQLDRAKEEASRKFLEAQKEAELLKKNRFSNKRGAMQEKVEAKSNQGSRRQSTQNNSQQLQQEQREQRTMSQKLDSQNEDAAINPVPPQSSLTLPVFNQNAVPVQQLPQLPVQSFDLSSKAMSILDQLIQMKMHLEQERLLFQQEVSMTRQLMRNTDQIPQQSPHLSIMQQNRNVGDVLSLVQVQIPSKTTAESQNELKSTSKFVPLSICRLDDYRMLEK